MVTTRSKAKAEATQAASEASSTKFIKPDTRRLPRTPPVQSEPLSSPELPSTPLKKKRKRAYHDSPIPWKMIKTKSTGKAITRPVWLGDLEKEDLEPPQSPTPAASGTIEDEDIGKDEEKQMSNLGPKAFQQDSFSRSWEEIGLQQNLEFFQAYPHDEFSTLCVGHFMELAESWYSRRKPMVNYQVQKMVRAGWSCKPDFSKFALPVCDKTRTVKNLQSFKVDLHKAINNASSRVKLNHKKILQATGNRPMCELGNQDHPLKCALCTNYELPCKGDYVEVDKSHCRMDIPPCNLDSFDAELEKALRPIPYCCHRKPLTILGGGKCQDYMECEQCSYVQELPQPPLQEPKEYAVKVAGTRIPVKIHPKRQYLNSKLGHADVGGIHFIVDHCVDKLMIKFRSTRFSEAHEMYGFDFHQEDEIKMVGNDPPEESADDLHEYDNEEDPFESETAIAQFDKRFWQEGAFDAIAECSNLFQDCSCH
ncbi:hypothetical protein IL306_011309 [Fusarium sp. DS 682]|nr:hypothetical protein IL306_011309 [Fusarium sp. DS 682]